MKNKFLIISLLILVVGVLFRLALTENGNFLFGIDSGRDFVMVREMVELRKLRLTGPNTSIDGLYDGPFWYYLLGAGYVLSRGDPYSAILMQILLWVVGGIFLLKIIKNFGGLTTIAIGSLWVASNYLVLTNLYSFNPTPVMLLSPLFIYLLVEYVKTGKAIYGILTWFLAGLFFNLEMNFGVFTPIIIVVSIILTRNTQLLKQKWFWLGLFVFISTLLPQVIFDLKHQFIMSKAVLRHLSENTGSSLNVLAKLKAVSANYYNTFVPTLANHKLLANIILIFAIPAILRFIKAKKKNNLIVISLVFVLVPFFGYLILPVTVNPWHLGAGMAVSLILIAYLFKGLKDGNFFSRMIAIVLSISIIWFALSNNGKFFLIDRGQPSLDPASYKNQIAAIDYVYQKAQGQNFKVYMYLPSVYDYSYQYLFWWYGQKKYGFLPIDYAYAPNKTPYISNKLAFTAIDAIVKNRANSSLVFLIKEPDRNYTRPGWEGQFVQLEKVGKEMVGPIEIEIRKELRIKN